MAGRFRPTTILLLAACLLLATTTEAGYGNQDDHGNHGDHNGEPPTTYRCYPVKASPALPQAGPGHCLIGQLVASDDKRRKQAFHRVPTRGNPCRQPLLRRVLLLPFCSLHLLPAAACTFSLPVPAATHPPSSSLPKQNLCLPNALRTNHVPTFLESHAKHPEWVWVPLAIPPSCQQCSSFTFPSGGPLPAYLSELRNPQLLSASHHQHPLPHPQSLLLPTGYPCHGNNHEDCHPKPTPFFPIPQPLNPGPVITNPNPNPLPKPSLYNPHLGGASTSSISQAQSSQQSVNLGNNNQGTDISLVNNQQQTANLGRRLLRPNHPYHPAGPESGCMGGMECKPAANPTTSIAQSQTSQQTANLGNNNKGTAISMATNQQQTANPGRRLVSSVMEEIN